MENKNSIWPSTYEDPNEKKTRQIIGTNFLRRSKTSFLILCFTMFAFIDTMGQTTLISPTGDGGFENGSTFAANGWTVSNSTNNPWIVAPLSNGVITGNAAFISDDGTTPSYSNSSISSNFFWRDVTIPAGEVKIKLDFNWIANGETSWDIWQVFIAPTTVTPSASNAYPGSGTTSIPAGIAGATFVANGTVQGTVQTTSLYLPTTLAGTTFRLIFHWKNDGGGGIQPPAQIDNISLVSSMPGNFVSIATGNWNSATTWDANAVPTFLDNIVISTGDVVTINATNQANKNVTVNGTLTYGTTPTTFAIGGDLTVNNGGVLNVFSGTTGKTVTVAGNIINNGTIDLSVGNTSSGNLTLNGTTVQTVSGTGTFNTGVIRNLICNNTSTAIPNINWLVNDVKIVYNLNLTGAKINLGSNKLTFGNNAVGNTLTAPVGTGFLPGGKFSRWWTATSTGSAINAGTDPTNTTSRYPFIDVAGQNRAMYISRTNSTGAVAGELAVTYTDASTMTTGLSVVDAGYTITNRYDGSWAVSNEGTPVFASSYTLAIIAQNSYPPLNGNSRILGSSASISGTHQNGTTTPGAQRTLVSQADLLAGPLYIGIEDSDISFASTSSGDWNNPTTWNRGTVPTCADAIVIATGHNVTVNSVGNVSNNLNIHAGGTLTVDSGDLTVGCTMNNNSFINNGTLTVSNGTLNINGNMLHNTASTFNQSGGDIIVDGNDAGIVANSVASGTAIVQLNSDLINLTGGVLTVVDPHAATAATNTIAYLNSTAHVNVAKTHTLKIGNGISTDAGGNATNGFRINTWASSRRILFGNLDVNTLVGTNRHVTTSYALGFSGDVMIASGSDVVFGTTYVAGNITNNGNFSPTASLVLSNFMDGSETASTDPQTISGSGVFKNSTTTVTANLSSFTVNNTNVVGVTLDLPLSISGTLTMTSGIINTTNTNLLTLGTGTVTGTLAGTPSVTNMIKGPFARTIANNNTSFINFPVGKSAYSPISLAPTTTVASVMKAESFDANAGIADPAVINLSSDRRWETSVISGNFTDIQVRLGDALIGLTDIPVQAPSAAGVYTSSFGSVATYAAGTPNTTESINAITEANYTGFLSFAESNVCSGTPVPGNTIASATTICLGESITVESQNSTVGTGVSYQWKSSTDGVTYTAITGETNPTLTTTPIDESYYIVDVTCATGPATGSSTPVQINFFSSITASTPATRCGTGTVTLNATPSTGAIVSWYADPIGGVVLGTGTSFTSPSIATSTTYYASSSIVSPGYVTVGKASTLTGAIDQPTAFCNRWPNYWSQTIYTAAELMSAGLSAGNITSMAYNIATLGDAPTNANFTVNIGNSPSGSFASNAFISTAFTNVYGPVTYTHTASGWQTIPFSTPFVWDGVSDIIIDVKYDGANSINNSRTYYTTTVNDNVLWKNSYSGTTTTGTLSKNRLNITLQGETACYGVRVPVVATVTAPPALTLSATSEVICSGQSSPTVTVTTGSTDYDTYTWSPASGVSGDAVSGYVFNPTVTTTYTLTATQTAGTLCATTVDFTVTVNELPSALTITPATPTVCVDSIQMLSATGGNVNNVTILSEDFNGATNSWTTINLSTGGTPAAAAWTLRADGYDGNSSNDASQYYMTDSDAQGLGGTTETYLVSPSFSTLNYVNATVDFYQYFNQYTSSTAKVQYSVDGTSWTDLATYINDDGSSTAFAQKTISLPAAALNQANVQVRFKYNGSWEFFWALDNVTIQGAKSTNITWSPATNLYTDAAGTIAYVGGTNAPTVYVKSATAGTLTYTVSATNASTLCAATATTNVTVNAGTTNTTTETSCDTYTWAVNGTVYTASGTYTSVSGCHTEELVLTITPSTTNTTTETACDTYTWAVNGTTYTTSGTYTVVTGCHTEELILTITPTSTNTTTEVSCDTYTWAVNGTTYTTSGTYTEIVGCVVEELVLTITSSTTNTTTETVCDTYTWAVNGTTYTTSGTYTSVVGCDTETLILTVNASPVTTITRTGDDLSSDEAGATSYQWGTCDGAFSPITGATSQSYKPTVIGKYAVQIIKNGCEVTSECFDVTTLDVKSLDVSNLNLYPNPVTNALIVTYTQNITGIQVYDVTGRLLKNIVTNTNEVSIDMSEMPASLYIVKVIAENTFSEFRVVKN